MAYDIFFMFHEIYETYKHTIIENNRMTVTCFANNFLSYAILWASETSVHSVLGIVRTLSAACNDKNLSVKL